MKKCFPPSTKHNKTNNTTLREMLIGNMELKIKTYGLVENTQQADASATCLYCIISGLT